ncbi:L-2-hydroxyglutarate oxidase [Gemmobacter sp.]|uniref:L-2-hydroxyglutarate oxidase n=1 Tax=Gemmobacter sp. TaxID=1898957 RepID=UPI002AFF09A1|nr:L-2-hydroxyglutarate oxidase [Gemmobacter sp.]
MDYDYCIIGGGIVGLATAMAVLKRKPGAGVLVLEKETTLGAHQTGHNSGVIHAGVYYAPGSLKAELCVRGLAATYSFCEEHGVPVVRCGKLIVATNPLEMSRIDALYDRAITNGTQIERVSEGELREREPNITGLGALFSPQTGIVGYAAVCAAMGQVIGAAGGEIRLGAPVTRIAEGPGSVEIDAGGKTITCGKLIACAGLQSDRIAGMAGLTPDFRIVPFRGEYFRLPAARNDIVQHLIYPAPDPDLPFLGIHLTRMIDGSVTVGPNAVLGLAREGYPKLSVNLRDTLDLMSYAGFWRLVWQQRASAAHELWQSASRRAYLQACRKYCPSLTLDDLQPTEAGIRAQAVTPDGTAIHDFHFAETARTLHVCNAPSPAATSAIPIGEMIADRAA